MHLESKGKFSSLLKPTKREPESSKEEEKSLFEVSMLKKANDNKDVLIAELKDKVKNFEYERIEFLDDRAKLAKLYDMGLIDNAGDPLLAKPPDDPDTTNKEELMKF